MKRILWLSIFPLASLGHAQVSATGHFGGVYHYASSQTSGHGHNGNDLNDDTDATLNGDTGVVTSTFANPNVHATIANYVATGRSQNSFDAAANAYAVHLQASLFADVTLDSLGFVGIQSHSVDGLVFDLLAPITLTVAWSAATESYLELYDPSGKDLLGADLTSAGSKTLLLPAGSSYQILGEVNEYENAVGYYGYTGGHFSGASSLDYHFGVSPVPEPASFAALALASLAFVRRRKS